MVSRVSISAVIFTPDISTTADTKPSNEILRNLTTYTETPRNNTGKLQINIFSINITFRHCKKNPITFEQGCTSKWQKVASIVKYPSHYSDVIMGMIASQITNLTTVYSTVCSDADQRKHQSSASLAFVRGIHRGPVNSLHKWPVTRKMFPFDDVIMYLAIFVHIKMFFYVYRY